MNTPDKVIKIAKGEIGYLEKSKSAYQKNPKILDDKTAGAGSDNYTKYGRDMHKVYPSVMDFPAAWCDCFVDWCFYMAYGVSTAKSLLGGNLDDYTVSSAQMYKNKKAYIKRGEGKPQEGDQIFFRNSTRICHTGLVYQVDSKYVYTIEGNTSGASGVIANGGGVCAKKYLLTSTYIDGYGRPKYDKAETKAKTVEVAKPTLKKGSKGAEVKRLQKNLNDAGSRDSKNRKLELDGEFGTNTLCSLKKFQQKNKLTVDGVYGPKTEAVMIKTLK